MASVVRRLKPLADRVLVQRAPQQLKTAGGVLLPESAVSRVNEATVVAVGPGSRNRDGEIVPLPIEVGAKVMLPEYGGHAVKLGDGDDNEFALFRADDLLGVFEE
mmetsp:Transcript_30171/g.62164  ORF Transcript_30171/g.62164 Transcript_30171/m.62164 type:complete len:105 (+) Transcript_30171:81-395(+)